MAENKPTAERRILGVSFSDWVKMGLGFLLGIILMAVSNWWNAKAPHLNYVVADPISYQGDKAKFGVINISVTNDGNKEAEGVECSFTANSEIQEVKLAPDTLHAASKVDKTKCSVSLPLLNSGGSLQ